jgi:hypothetical protein
MAALDSNIAMYRQTGFHGISWISKWENRRNIATFSVLKRASSIYYTDIHKQANKMFTAAFRRKI